MNCGRGRLPLLSLVTPGDEGMLAPMCWRVGGTVTSPLRAAGCSGRGALDGTGAGDGDGGWDLPAGLDEGVFVTVDGVEGGFCVTGACWSMRMIRFSTWLASWLMPASASCNNRSRCSALAPMGTGMPISMLWLRSPVVNCVV